MMSLSTREVRNGGMIFSLLSTCGLVPNNLEYSHKKGIHSKSLHLMLDGRVYLKSFSMDKSVRLVLFFV